MSAAFACGRRYLSPVYFAGSTDVGHGPCSVCAWVVYRSFEGWLVSSPAVMQPCAFCHFISDAARLLHLRCAFCIPHALPVYAVLFLRMYWPLFSSLDSIPFCYSSPFSYRSVSLISSPWDVIFSLRGAERCPWNWCGNGVRALTPAPFHRAVFRSGNISCGRRPRTTGSDNCWHATIQHGGFGGMRLRFFRYYLRSAPPFAFCRAANALAERSLYRCWDLRITAATFSLRFPDLYSTKTFTFWSPCAYRSLTCRTWLRSGLCVPSGGATDSSSRYTVEPRTKLVLRWVDAGQTAGGGNPQCVPVLVGWRGFGRRRLPSRACRSEGGRRKDSLSSLLLHSKYCSTAPCVCVCHDGAACCELRSSLFSSPNRSGGRKFVQDNAWRGRFAPADGYCGRWTDALVANGDTCRLAAGELRWTLC